jgi:hypothetical protein
VEIAQRDEQELAIYHFHVAYSQWLTGRAEAGSFGATRSIMVR